MKVHKLILRLNIQIYHFRNRKVMRSSTPPQQRHSKKKIIIKSPSEEIIRFLNIPNPAVNIDPRQRLHIISPMNHSKSLKIINSTTISINNNNNSLAFRSMNSIKTTKVVPQSPQMNRNSRIGLIRKKAAAAASNKIQDGWLSKSSNLKIDQSNPNRNLFISNMRQEKLLNFTFGFQRQMALFA